MWNAHSALRISRMANTPTNNTNIIKQLRRNVGAVCIGVIRGARSIGELIGSLTNLAADKLTMKIYQQLPPLKVRGG